MSNEITKFDLKTMTEKVAGIKEKIAHHRDELREAISELEDFTGLLDTSIDSLEAAESHMTDAQLEIIGAADSLSEQV